jgi:hypothetical protein
MRRVTQGTIVPATESLPQSVLYVKNGAGGKWWLAAKANGQIHAGWSNVPRELLTNPDYEAIKQHEIDDYARAGKLRKSLAVADANALWRLLDAPSQHVWITFEDSSMWWCTVRDGAVINPTGRDEHSGNFWLVCDRKWSNESLVHKRKLAISMLPGTVSATAGFRATVAKPKAWETILRIIRDEQDDDAIKAAEARASYVAAIDKMVKRLHWKDFELLIDLVFARTGWTRISVLGATQKDIDMEVRNLTADEIAFVQVKSESDQAELNRYVERFEAQSDRYARMIFAVHTSEGLTAPADDPRIQVWTGERIAPLVVGLGLGEWVETKLA